MRMMLKMMMMMMISSSQCGKSVGEKKKKEIFTPCLAQQLLYLFSHSQNLIQHEQKMVN